MDTGSVVLVFALLFDVAGATLLLIYGPAPGGILARRRPVGFEPPATPPITAAAHTARMTRLGLALVLLGFIIPFAAVVVQALGS